MLTVRARDLVRDTILCLRNRSAGLTPALLSVGILELVGDVTNAYKYIVGSLIMYGTHARRNAYSRQPQLRFAAAKKVRSKLASLCLSATCTMKHVEPPCHSRLRYVSLLQCRDVSPIICSLLQ